MDGVCKSSRGQVWPDPRGNGAQSSICQASTIISHPKTKCEYQLLWAADAGCVGCFACPAIALHPLDVGAYQDQRMAIAWLVNFGDKSFQPEPFKPKKRKGCDGRL